MKEEKAQTMPLDEPRRKRIVHSVLGSLLVLVLMFAALAWKHNAWVFAPNDSYIRLTMDGMKNYMTFGYNVAHDSTYIRYTGMNYPYGEHELFTDNQPLLSNIAQWWHQNIADLSGHVVGVMNMFQLMSALFGALMLFWLLRRLGIGLWYAVAAALGIALLSPQYLRFDGHFGLSHTWIIPLLLLILMYYEERNSRRYASLWMCMAVTAIGMLHFYNFGMAALFIGLYVGFSIIADFSFSALYKRTSHLIVMVGFPFFILNFWIHWDAFSSMRTATPYGFTRYIGQWEAVFLPYEHFPLYQWIDKYITPIRDLNTPESLSYVGVVASLFSLFLIFSGFSVLRKKERLKTRHVDHRPFLLRAFLAAVVLLLFACGFPFILNGMEWMIDYFGPIRQFRGLGRFCWPFYYVVNIMAFFAAYHFGKNTDKPWKKALFWGLPLLLIGYEAFFFQKNLPEEAHPNMHLESNLKQIYKENVWLDVIHPEAYQAVLPLPYYHLGSENIWIEPSYSALLKTQLTAFHTGLPDMGVMMSRTPLDQTAKSVQMAYYPCQVPMILDDLPNRKPILILINPDRKKEATSKHGHLLRHAIPVLSNPEIELYRLFPDSLRLAAQEERQKAKDALTQAVLYPNKSPYRSTKPQQDFVYMDFEAPEYHQSQRFRGKGARYLNFQDTFDILNQPLSKGRHVLSLWSKADQDMGLTLEAQIFETDADGVPQLKHHEGLCFHLKTIVNGWAMYEFAFEVQESNSTSRIMLWKAGVDASYIIDEVLVRPADTQVFAQEDTWLGWNGYWYE